MSQLLFELDHFAEEEFYSIVDYYKQFDTSLAADFIQEFDRATKRLRQFPDAGSPYLHQTQRIILKRFPYAIVYKMYNEKRILVHAVMHLKRKPGYWTEHLE